MKVREVVEAVKNKWERSSLGRLKLKMSLHLSKKMGVTIEVNDQTLPSRSFFYTFLFHQKSNNLKSII